MSEALTKAEFKQRVFELAAKCKYDPLSWAEIAFPWGRGELEDKALRKWQRQVLSTIRDHVSDPEKRKTPCRVSVASGHGIGKSALLSIVSNWAMTCFARPRVVVTANTENQLKSKTSPEMAKWFKLSLSAPFFNVETMSIRLDEKAEQDRWRLDFTPWSATNTEAFAGLHNQSITVLIMDEGSAIDDLIWEVAEGAQTDEDALIIWLVFGNPTRNVGRFRECFRRFKKFWHTFQIDSREVEGTNKELFAQWAETYGEDSDFFKVRVRGMFPSASSRQYIGTDLVDEAFGKHLRKEQYDFAPVIISCDPAWTGDDELIIAKRQGLHFEVLEIMPKNDNDIFVAQKIAAYEDKYQADAVFIDGGYGTGIFSAGSTWGRSWRLVWFSGKSPDRGMLNMRVFMWNKMRKWLEAGGSIPVDQTLYEDLIGPETLPRDDGVEALEGKEHMRKRNLPSPNRADALALTFAEPVVKRYRTGHLPETGSRAEAVSDEVFDPYA